MRGRFISFEGIDGAGKSTQHAWLVDYLRRQGRTVVATREPGGTPFAEKLRALLLEEKSDGMRFPLEAEFSLFWAARFDHIDKVINPALRDGKTVICDRFDMSTYAYQVCASGEGRLLSLFLSMREHMLRILYEHPLYLHFDLAPEIGLGRVRSRGETLSHFDKKELDFHESLRAGFKKFHRLSVHNALVIDPDVVTVNAALTPEEVYKQVERDIQLTHI